MKQYLNSIRRRLALPGDVKKRVMSDLESSIQARREAGQTDEEIRAELGTPRQAAADLNQQMKEYAYRKSPWRFAFLALAVVAGWNLLTNYLPAAVISWYAQSILSREAASVGIIGGADGPTAIFLTGPIWGYAAFFAILLVAGILGYVLLKRLKQK